MKEVSARKFMVWVFSTTYCLIMVGCTIALLKKIIATDTYIALLATFSLIVKGIAEDYFGREDRKQNGKEGGNGQKTS